MNAMWWWLGLALALEPAREPLKPATIDWTHMEVQASATGASQSGILLTLESMESNARAAVEPLLYEAAKQVRFSSTQTVGDLLSQGDAVADRVEDSLQQWEVTEVRYLSSGQVEVDAALPLGALLRPALAAAARGKERTSAPTSSISGLVVDARGLHLQPVVAPRILAPDGTVLYSVETLTPFAASQGTPAVYVTDLADPLAVKKSGDEPLFLLASKVENASDLVLNQADAAALEKASGQAAFLLNGKVVVVVDHLSAP